MEGLRFTCGQNFLFIFCSLLKYYQIVSTLILQIWLRQILPQEKVRSGHKTKLYACVKINYSDGLSGFDQRIPLSNPLAVGKIAGPDDDPQLRYNKYPHCESNSPLQCNRGIS